jgi:hypothetical protein
MGIAAEAFHFEIQIAGIESITERWRRLGWSLEGEHAFVPGFAGKAVGDLARFPPSARNQAK